MMAAKDRRVRATLALSPSIAHPDTPTAVWQAISAIDAPVMIIHGTRDAQWTSDGPLRVYDALPFGIPRAYVEIDGMGHTPTSADDAALVLRYATAFFRYYLRDDREVAVALFGTVPPPRVSLRTSRFP
jgi:pimeloyl-ACP methyl ester carboxylesterase